MEWLRAFLDNGIYAPHGYCLLWRPELVWTHVIADGLTAAAYFSIPVALLVFVRKRKDIEFGYLFWLFALFILACGTTHLFAIWNLWNSDYGWEGAVKAVTAVASVLTAMVIWPMIPRALALPSPSALQLANEQLTASLLDRDAALERLREEIAERKRTEQQLVQAKKIDALGQLTGGIAHDFNNLLQAISSSLELIERAPDRVDRVLKWTGMGRGAAEKAQRLTAQLLTFARDKATVVETIAVTPMIQGMRELLDRTLDPMTDLAIETESDPLVDVDRTQLELAVMNLVINARDATGQGGRIVLQSRPVRIDGAADLHDGDYVAISVADDGCGMSAEAVSKAFEPFFTTKESGAGTGLGLSMVHGFSSQANGTVRIETEEGVGTVVTILLPKSGSAASADQPIEPGLGADVDLSGLSVLVVDDDDGVRSSMVEALKLFNADVSTAESGSAALESLEKRTVDVVLTDFAMPGMDGAALAEAVRRQYPDIRVLVATGYADFDAIERALGPSGRVLRKPFSLQDLVAALAPGRG
ncbi:MAG: ATP-binding protein [Pacificimonas sp.]|jgi:signal transduction histidine kinase/CheY-like chemotaxis protein|nr:ATP-binding protein [Pacificimonas sp.]